MKKVRDSISKGRKLTFLHPSIGFHNENLLNLPSFVEKRINLHKMPQKIGKVVKVFHHFSRTATTVSWIVPSECTCH